MPKLTLRTSLYTATALTSALFSQPAFADCISQAPVNPGVVTCTPAGTTGFDGTVINGMVVTVTSGTTVSTSAGGAALINTGTGSVVDNYAGDFATAYNSYAIDAGSSSSNAISLGGGSTFNNMANSNIMGKISFGDATGTAVNTVNNFWSSGASTVANMESDITSAGNTVINNQGFFSYSGYSHITQTGLGTVVINNGVTGGYDPATASAVEYNNAVMWADITTAGSTTFTNALGAGLYYDTAGYTLGTNHTGTTTVTNLGQIEGQLTTADNINVITNGSTGTIAGDITMTGTTNTLSNQYVLINGGDLVGRIDGTISATGNFTLSNQGQIGTDVYSDVIQTGAGSVSIDNGINGGYANALGAFVQNAVINTNEFGITTQGSTALVNRGGGNPFGAQIYGTVELGTLALGTSTIVNGTQQFGAGSIFGNVVMGDRVNVVTNDGYITGDVTMTGTGSNAYNAGTLGSSGDNGHRLPGVDFSDGPGVTSVTGTLTGLAANSANNTLNLNGIDDSTLTSGSVVLNFGTVNKNDSGTWFLNNTLDGNAGSLTALNITDGALVAYGANYVGNGNTTITMGQYTDLRWENVTGRFNGNIVSSAGADSGVEIYVSNLTLGGTNTYAGYLDVNSSSVSTASNGAFSANADLYIFNDSEVNVNNNVTVNNLFDDGAESGNFLYLNGANTSLTLNSGDWGDFQGVALGNGQLIKTSTGTLYLYGSNTVNLTGGGSLLINNGSVSVYDNSVSASTAVVVNSTATTAGSLDIYANDSIGSLAGTGANAVVSITDAVLGVGSNNTDTSYAGKITGNGGLVKQGTGTLTLTGLANYTGNTSVNLGTLTGFAGTTAANGSLQGAIFVGLNGALVFDQTLSTLGNTSGTFAGTLTGTGAVSVKGNGAGVLTLSGDNTGFAGPMYLTSGSRVSIASETNLGTGLLELTDAMLLNTGDAVLGNTISLVAPITAGRPGGTFQTAAATTFELGGDIFGDGQLVKTGTGTLALYGENSYTGGTLVSSGVLKGTAGYSVQGDIVNNATVQLTGFFDIYEGNMSGTGNLVVDGDTLIALDGTNTYTGTTSVTNGANLFSFSDGGLANQSAFTVNGTLTSVAETNTIGSLAGTGSVIATHLNIGANNTSTTFSGQFTDDGGQFVTEYISKIGTGTLTLTGAGSVLNGALTVNGGTLALGSTGTLTAATTTVNTGTVFSLDGTLTSPTMTVAAGGRLVGGIGTAPGTIVGAVTNNGTIAPGHSPGILAISGSYVQTSTGTYAAEVNGNGTSTVVAGVDFDRIAVSGVPGTAVLAGTLAVTQNGGRYLTGTAYDIITTSGGISGGFTTVTGTSISAFQSLSNATATGGGIQGNNYRLVVTRAAYNTVALNPNQVATGNGLTGIIGSTGSSATINQIDAMNAAQAQALFQGLNPEPYAAYATALQDQGELFTRQVGQRLAATTGEDAKSGLWINNYGQWAKGKSSDYRFGSDHKIIGGAVGVDFGSGPVRFGVAGGYSEDEVTYLGLNSAGQSKSWQVGGYMGYGSGPLHFNAQAAYISGNITATKLVAAGSGFTLIQGTAAVDTDGHLFKGIATAGYNMGGSSLTFEPFVGIDFTSGHINGFTETGMGTLNLTVRDIEAKRTDLVVGARFAAPTGSIMPYANVTYRYNLDKNPAVVTGYFNGVSGAPFTVSAIGSGRSAFDVDAGISARIGTGASVFVGYQGTFRKDLNSHGVNGGLRVSF